MKKIFAICALLSCFSAIAQTVGSKVAFTTPDGKKHTGTIKETKTVYKVQYDDINYAQYLTQEQFTPLPPADSTPAGTKTKDASKKAETATTADKTPSSFKVSDIKGTYVCVSGGVPELMADGTVSKASLDAAKATIRSYSSALKYLFRGDGTYADLTYGDKYAADPKYNGIYKLENGKVNMYAGGILFFTFQPARNEENKVMLIQVHDAKDRYKAQFCQLVRQ